MYLCAPCVWVSLHTPAHRQTSPLPPLLFFWCLVPRAFPRLMGLRAFRDSRPLVCRIGGPPPPQMASFRSRSSLVPFLFLPTSRWPFPPSPPPRPFIHHPRGTQFRRHAVLGSLFLSPPTLGPSPSHCSYTYCTVSFSAASPTLKSALLPHNERKRKRRFFLFGQHHPKALARRPWGPSRARSAASSYLDSWPTPGRLKARSPLRSLTPVTPFPCHSTALLCSPAFCTLSTAAATPIRRIVYYPNLLPACLNVDNAPTVKGLFQYSSTTYSALGSGITRCPALNAPIKSLRARPRSFVHHTIGCVYPNQLCVCDWLMPSCPKANPAVKGCLGKAIISSSILKELHPQGPVSHCNRHNDSSH